MRRGWTREMILGLIDRYTQGRIPENVRISLEEWTAKFGQIRLKQTVLVECNTKELADEISHIPEIKAMLKYRVSER
ncbi:MAG: helicase-associated domain-containing protein [bacterium]